MPQSYKETPRNRFRYVPRGLKIVPNSIKSGPLSLFDGHNRQIVGAFAEFAAGEAEQRGMGVLAA